MSFKTILNSKRIILECENSPVIPIKKITTDGEDSFLWRKIFTYKNTIKTLEFVSSKDFSKAKKIFLFYKKEDLENLNTLTVNEQYVRIHSYKKEPSLSQKTNNQEDPKDKEIRELKEKLKEMNDTLNRVLLSENKLKSNLKAGGRIRTLLNPENLFDVQTGPEGYNYWFNDFCRGKFRKVKIFSKTPLEFKEKKMMDFYLETWKLAGSEWELDVEKNQVSFKKYFYKPKKK